MSLLDYRIGEDEAAEASNRMTALRLSVMSASPYAI